MGSTTRIRRSTKTSPAAPRAITTATAVRRDQRRTTWLAVMIPDTLWFAVAWSAAIDGVFRPGALPLPVLPLAIFLPVMIGAPLLLLSKRVGQVLDAMPASWLV